MDQRYNRQNWAYDRKRSLKDWRVKDIRLWLSDIIESLFKFRLGEYKPYQLVGNFDTVSSKQKEKENG